MFLPRFYSSFWKALLHFPIPLQGNVFFPLAPHLRPQKKSKKKRPTQHPLLCVCSGAAWPCVMSDLVQALLTHGLREV